MAGKTFHCTAVTPEGKVLDTEAVSAVFPAYDGQQGVLPNHAPLLTRMGIGVLRVTTPGGVREEIYVDSGFAQIADNKLTVLSERAKPVEELDPEDVELLWAEARAHTGVSDPAVEARDRAYERARVHQRLTRR
jgi:F-type H+-transporting ATPase subunit epsilon